MDLNVKIHPRNNGKFFHRVPSGIHANEAKKIAIKDISEEICHDRSWGRINYLGVENGVMISTTYNHPFIYFDYMFFSKL